jgi:hypothetical protein
MDAPPPAPPAPVGGRLAGLLEKRAPISLALSAAAAPMLVFGLAPLGALLLLGVAGLWWGRWPAMAALFAAAIGLALWMSSSQKAPSGPPRFQPYLRAPALDEGGHAGWGVRA